MKVFTFTPGRTGTAYLAECFKQNASPDWHVEHEGPFYGGFGRFRPDISHLHAYNCNAQKEHLRRFWRQKFKSLPENYLETSHINCKAGLVEHIDLLQDHVVIIHLRRRLRDVFLSMAARGSMISKSDMWMWHLDPDYPANLTAKDEFAGGMLGNIAWYLLEMEARGRRLKAVCPCEWLEVRLEDIAESKGLEKLLKYFGIGLSVIPPRCNANPDLEFDAGFLAAADTVVAELEEKIKRL
jgi:hypothetical protein